MLSMYLVVDTNRRSIPVYRQIADQLRYLILTGNIKPGESLPSSRHLSRFLKVNRKTILLAMKLLSEEGLVVSDGKRGYIANPNLRLPSPEARLAVDELIQKTIAEAIRRDIDLTYIIGALYAHWPASGSHVVVIECNQPAAERYCHDIEQALAVSTYPVLIQDLLEPSPKLLQMLNEAAVIVTTFTHLSEVKELIGELVTTDILGLSASHLLRLQQKLKMLPKRSSLAIVTVSPKGAQEMVRSVTEAGLPFSKVIGCSVSEGEQLFERVSEADYVAVASTVAPEIQRRLATIRPVLVYENRIDEASLEMLRRYLSEKATGVYLLPSSLVKRREQSRYVKEVCSYGAGGAARH